MKRIVVFAFVISVMVALCQVIADDSLATVSSDTELKQLTELAKPGVAMQRMDLMPLAFTENRGQWDEQVKFRANAGGATMWFTEEGIYYQFTRRISANDPRGRQMSTSAPFDRLDHEPDSIEQLVIKASFVGSNPDVEVVGEGLMEYKYNYFMAMIPTKWHTDVPNLCTTLTMFSKRYS